MDASAFGGKGIATSQEPQYEDFGDPPSALADFTDRDGLPVPPMWRASKLWAGMPLATRKQLSDRYVKEQQRLAAKEGKAPKPYLPRFSTQYAVDWGRKQGWKVVDRERYDFRTKRSHDVELGMDVIFDDGERRVGVQAAGKSQRAEHYRRFMERGGTAAAKRRGMSILYIEFVRDNRTPVSIETWAA